MRNANGAIPPSRWHPAHVSRTIGATSRAKSGVAAGAAPAEPLPSASAARRDGGEDGAERDRSDTTS